jgi:hypothetical protein
MMNNKRTIPANDNVPMEVRWEEAFPSPRTIDGNPITNITEKWLKDEKYLYVGQSKEGFHAAIAIPGHDHPLPFGTACPTAKEAKKIAISGTKSAAQKYGARKSIESELTPAKRSR